MNAAGPESKVEIRRSLREVRALLGVERRAELSAAVVRRLEQLPLVGMARCLGVYAAMAEEVDLRALCLARWARGAMTAFPRTAEGGWMEFGVVERSDRLRPGRFGILEPDETCLPAQLTCVLVPGVAFDRAGGRIGMGAGFYDRYLADHPEVPAVGVAFGCQVVERVPMEAHDRRMDVLVTDAMVWCCSDRGREMLEQPTT